MVLMRNEILWPLSMDEYDMNVFLLRDVYIEQADPDKELHGPLNRAEFHSLQFIRFLKKVGL